MLLNQIPMNLFGIFPTLMREHFFFFIYAIATLWLISIAACRRKSWGIVLWLPPFLGLAWWIIFRVLPLFSIITHASGAGPGAGFYGMGAAYALIANLPIGICWIILLLLRPRIGTPNRWTTLCAVAICPPIYVFLYLLSTETIPLRVVDQDGKGIGHCSVAYVLVSMPEKRYERSTDAEGFCRFRTIPGMGMDITSISASGYESEPNMQRSYLLPNKSPTNPMLFRMWSTNIHEELIAGNKSFKIVPDGRPYFIDLTHDTISETSMGDLKVWIQYTNNGVVGQQANWGAQVDVVNGGLLEEKDACFFDVGRANQWICPDVSGACGGKAWWPRGNRRPALLPRSKQRAEIWKNDNRFMCILWKSVPGPDPIVLRDQPVRFPTSPIAH